MAEPVMRPRAATHERLRRESRREPASRAVITSGARSTTMWVTVRPVSSP